MSKSKSYKQTHIGNHKLHPETQMMSYGYDPFMSEGAVKPPVFLTSTFAFKSAEDGADFFDVVSGRKPAPEGQTGGLIYSRFNHPNLEITEDRMALLEEGEMCSIFSSGMAAISAVLLTFLKPGDVIVQSSPLYGGTETLIRKSLKNWQIESLEFRDGLNQQLIEETLEEAVKKGRVGMVFIETPANPTNSLVDFAAVKKAVDNFEKKHGYRILTACDNTLLGPVFQKPLLHGIDLSCYSLTKYVGGHSDLVAGAVIGKKSLMEKVRLTRSTYGFHLDPHSAWMIGRSLETLSLRMNRAADSAKIIATWLAGNPQLKVKVNHPEFISEKDYQETYRKQCLGAGSTFSFLIEGGRPEAFKFINSLKIFKSAVSLGGSESLICHPASTTHSGVPLEMRQKFGIGENLIRISIGLENPADLIADLEQAFAVVR
jgi:cystathionine beta-lyase/cystathionine gamma-synthase